MLLAEVEVFHVSLFGQYVMKTIKHQIYPRLMDTSLVRQIYADKLKFQVQNDETFCIFQTYILDHIFTAAVEMQLLNYFIRFVWHNPQLFFLLYGHN